MPSRSSFSILALAAFLLACPGAAEAQEKAKVKVKVLKPLVLTSMQDLDFGMIAAPDLASPVTVSIGQDGVLDCPAPLTCSGNALPAMYNVKGSKRARVLISIVASDLVNPADGSRLVFTPDAPASIDLPNSGKRGLDFAVGGAIEIDPAASGDYSGTIEVTVDYR